MEQLRKLWATSRPFRVLTIAAAVYALLRLIIHAVFLVGVVQGGSEGYDLQLYLDAASNLWAKRPLYPAGRLDYVEFYQYAPAYALAFTPFLWLPMPVVMAVLTALHIVAYVLLYRLWGRIFRRLQLYKAEEALAWSLPLWLVFSQFWADLGYLNIYVFMALLATLLIEAVLDERLGWALLWLSIILQTKPQWAFAAAVPLFTGRWRFFARLILLALVVYAAIVGVVMLAVGPAYGWGQYVDYFRFLITMRDNLVWRGPEAPFLGYDHSITQIVVYLLGVAPETLHLATAMKLVLLLPLAMVSLRCLLRPGYRALGLDLAFLFYLGAFIWLDVVWEVTYGIIIFPYLLAALKQRGERALAWAVFLPYALLDLWQIASVALFGFDVIVPGPFILTDPAIYIPLVMIVILAFYALLIRRVWVKTSARAEASTAYGF
ncbi:MAG: DUF2029 domain-containing protein [Anaerolineae bacterium]|nr:DUF2029 domain-containing protein [Anaerolineae bacterium]